MIAYRLERAGQAAEDALAVVPDHRGLAVHDLAGVFHPPAERLADRLVSQADAEDRRPGGEMLHHGHADTRLLWRARPRRDDDLLRSHHLDILDRDLVIPRHFNLR